MVYVLRLLNTPVLSTLPSGAFSSATYRNRNTDQDRRRITDEEAADVSSPQGKFGDPQLAATRGKNDSASRSDDDGSAA